ncbi:MAG TPA: NepR family anti-sigma factor [Xanthobacteraceae bacterium]|nr:NepR family anti-sigma factor [Xanthobacteraceae bacterium]
MGRPIASRKTEVRLGREVQARIGQQLRAMYDEVVKEGVPPHIAELVRRLNEQDDG